MGDLLKQASGNGLRRIYRILCSLADCDGLTDTSERAVLQSFARDAGIDPEEARTLESEALNDRRLALGKGDREKKLLLEWMIEVVVADGVFDEAERRRMVKFSGPLGLEADEVVATIEKRLEEPEVAPEDEEPDEFAERRAELGLGPLWCPYLDRHPPFVRHGHGIVVLRKSDDVDVKIDGVPVGNTGKPHPYFTGGFRGYFNVPAGDHTLETKGVETGFSVKANCVEVLRFRGDHWELEGEEAQEHYRKQALSGAMVKSKVIRPWPLPSLYLWAGRGKVEGMVNGVDLPAAEPCLGITNLTPGSYSVDTSRFRVEFELPLESVHLVMLDDPNQDPEAYKDGILRTALRRMPRNALVRAESLKLKP